MSDGSTALPQVQDWIHSGADFPGYQLVQFAVSDLLQNMRLHMERAEDVLASSALDEIEEITKALRKHYGL